MEEESGIAFGKLVVPIDLADNVSEIYCYFLSL